MRTDIYEKRPSGMDEYLAVYGWHFSKKMAQMAANIRYGAQLWNPEYMERMMDKTEIHKHAKGYDHYYLVAMFRSVYPYLTDRQVVSMVDNYLAHEYDTAPFSRFYADSVATSTPIIWEDML